jgi:glycosyltransferase involved in cell wall biosynthesis
MTTREVTAIVPAYNAEATIGACLQAISALRPMVAKVIVFDDGATDRTNAIATAANVCVIRNNGPPRGPAHWRNATRTWNQLQFSIGDRIGLMV